MTDYALEKQIVDVVQGIPAGAADKDVILQALNQNIPDEVDRGSVPRKLDGVLEDLVERNQLTVESVDGRLVFHVEET